MIDIRYGYLKRTMLVSTSLPYGNIEVISWPLANHAELGNTQPLRSLFRAGRLIIRAAIGGPSGPGRH